MDWEQVPQLNVPDVTWDNEEESLLTQVDRIMDAGPKKKPRPPAPRPPAPRPLGRRPVQGGFATNNIGGGGMFIHPSQHDFMQAMGPTAQANTLANASQQTMQAWDKEHDSRVAQDREARRMEHEKELMRMQMENQRLVDDGALIRSLISR